MVTTLVSVLTFLSTFFAMIHFLCSFLYRNEPVKRNCKKLGFSLLIPCYNEAPIITKTIKGVLNLDYENYEAIFINDGSADETMQILKTELDLVPVYDCEQANSKGVRAVYRSNTHGNFLVVDKINSGKADSLNIGIRLSSKELIVTLDGDSVLERNALSIMNSTFQDEDVIASGGAVHVMQYFLLQNKKKAIISVQALDYIKGFYVYKPSLCFNNAVNIISGAFGVFRKQAVMEIGGFRQGLGEDIDMTIRLQKYALDNGKTITYNMNAICYTECPQTWRDLKRQRVRWQKAFWDAITKNISFLIRYFLRSNICFFMLLDAAFSGTMAVMTFFANYILISLKFIYGLSPMFLVFSLLAVIFNILNSLVAIQRAEKFGPDSLWKSDLRRRRTGSGPLFGIILMDLALFSLLRIVFFVYGTYSYIMKNTSWDKLKRTNNAYTL